MSLQPKGEKNGECDGNLPEKYRNLNKKVSDIIRGKAEKWNGLNDSMQLSDSNQIKMITVWSEKSARSIA